MYDFYFGNRNSAEFLISVKHMLPRWLNSVPDAEFTALFEFLEDIPAGTDTAETGVGATTLVFVYQAILHNRSHYTWDICSAKISEVRRILMESIGRRLGKRIEDTWTTIAYDSTSPFLGTQIFSELSTQKLGLFLHDSAHNLKVIVAELEGVRSRLDVGSIVCIDDANYDYAEYNVGHINVLRRKLGLPDIRQTAYNQCRALWKEIEDWMSSYYRFVRLPVDVPSSDPWIAYYEKETDIKAELGMERLDDLGHRLAAWKIVEVLQ